MKKLGLLLMPLITISLLASCNGSNTPQVVEHIVTFESNGGTHVDTQKVKDKSTATEPNPAPTKTDYTFGGWFISPDFAGGGYDFNTPVTEDITLYADWTGGPQPVIPSYTIDFQGENCTSTLDLTKQYHTGDEVNFTINLPNGDYTLPEKINVSGVSTFDYSNKTGEVSFTVESKDIGVIAKAGTIAPTVQHTVNFVLNGATSDPINPVKVNEGDPYPSDKIPDEPTKEGHTFEGWSKNEKSKDIVDLTKATINSDLILYAWWSDITYTVVFNANGGTYPASEGGQGTVTRENVPYNTMPEIPDEPTKVDSTGIKGYIFTGYDKNVVPVTGDNTNPITYTAKWKETTNIYSLTINGNGGHFSDGSTSKTLNIAAGTNIKSLAKTLPLIYDDLAAVKTVDKFTYSSGTEVGDDDVLNQDNTTIQATYRNKTLEECSWDEIEIISNQGKDFAASYFGPITSTSPLTKTVMVNNQPHTVRIIGYGQDKDENDTEIGITFEFVDLISDSNGYSLATYWKNTNTTEGSNSNYLNSSVRKALTGQGEGDLNWFEIDSKSFSTTFANKSVLDMLPSKLSRVLKTVKKTVNVKSGTNWTKTDFNDKLFLLNPKELGYNNQYIEDSKTYMYYEGHSDKEEAIRIKAQVKGAEGARTMELEGTDLAGAYEGTKYSGAGYNSSDTGCGALFWLRSPDTLETDQVWDVFYNGVVTVELGYLSAYGVAPAFCI